VSGWTVETLKEHLEAITARQDEAVAAALTAAKEAVLKAENAAAKRFDSVNEFRAQLTDQAATFMTRQESLARHEQAAEKIADIQDRLNRNEGRSSGISASWAALLGVAGLVGAVVAVITRFI
jgi:Flp pilus assembly protein TadB